MKRSLVALGSGLLTLATACGGDGSKENVGQSVGDALSVTGCAPGARTLTIERGNVRLDYDLGHGTATFSYAGASKVKNFYAGVGLGTYVTSKQYARHTCQTSGDETTVTSTGNGLPTMKQIFITGGHDHLLTRVTVTGSIVGSSWMGPVVVDTQGGIDVGSHADPRVLWVPFDNDAWVRYDAAPIDGASTSYEVAAFYDNTSRNGIVVGSVTHDTWKSGVYYEGSGGRLDRLNVFGGATDATWTHDVVPHGKVTGQTLSSPIVFVGYSADWRDLMEEYADANASYSPKLAWNGGVPFGWNSWGKIQKGITYQDAILVSSFIKSDLQAHFNDDGVAYVNLDSYWDNLTDAELASFVATCKQNGQKAGIYRAPFADWGGQATRAVEGSSRYTYGDLWLQDGAGKPITMHGAYALDPTHPGTKAQIDYYIDKFKALGFEYVKLDFLTFGAMESTRRFDPTVQTGIQAYNQGMQHIVDRIAGTMFISESIAPLFPYQYAHARRVSCDTYGAAVGNTMSSEYELNSAAYGWWMNGRTYTFNDPDDMDFEGYAPADNLTRLMSGVVTGTVFLNGDDLTKPAGQGLALKYLTNDAINAVARLGKAFRPVEGNSGSHAPELFVLEDGGVGYLAVFNFGSSTETRTIDLGRAGLDGARTYAVTSVWDGAASAATGTVSVTVASRAATLLKLE